MADLFLIVRLAGQRIALPAHEVEAVVEIEGLIPVPQAAAHVAGLSALRSRVLTVIDCLASLEPERRLPEGAREAVVAVVDGHGYALLVEGVEDVVEAVEAQDGAQCTGFSGCWRRIGRTTVDASGDLLLVGDVAALVAGPRPASVAA